MNSLPDRITVFLSVVCSLTLLLQICPAQSGSDSQLQPYLQEVIGSRFNSTQKNTNENLLPSGQTNDQDPWLNDHRQYPLFPDIQAGDDNWDDRFYENGINGSVTVILKDGNGDIYAGGQFTSINGDTSLRVLAKWDGNDWSSFGGPTDGGITTMLLNGNDLYIGGDFKYVDGIKVNGVAHWDGVNWSALGSGLDSQYTYVNVMAIQGTNLYAGGAFQYAGDITVNSIAKWDGNSWSALDNGVGDGYKSVNDIQVVGTDIYVGGYFYEASGVTVNHIAKWDGNNWSALGSGMFYKYGVITNIVAVGDMGIYDGDVYAGGGFKEAGGVPAEGLAKWDGNNWSALEIEGNPSDIEVTESELHILRGDTVFTWDGGSWSNMPLDFDNSVGTIYVNGSDMYFGGYFNAVENLWASKIARWDGNDWNAVGKPGLGMGLDYMVYAIASQDNSAYVGGEFITAGGIVADMIARWDGNNWDPLASGVDNIQQWNNNIRDILVNNTDIYVAGIFSSIGGIEVSGLAKWDGSSWSALPGCNVTGVRVFAKNGNDLYVGGSGGNMIGRWDGNTWHSLGSGLAPGDGRGWYIKDIAIQDTNVFVCGSFYIVEGHIATNYAQWNGNTWKNLFEEYDFDGGVDQIEVLGQDLYLFGSFEHAGGVQLNGMARWDGQNWYSLGEGFERVSQDYPAITCAVTSGIDIYIGGTFSGVDGVLANNIARWNGRKWSALGSGTDHSVYDIGVCQDYLMVGGSFSYAGGKSARFISAFTISEPTSQATNLSFNYRDATSLNVSFDPGADQPDGYLAIRRSGSLSTFTPEDGVTYTIGQAVGDGIVAFSRDSTGFSDIGLMPETDYYYSIYSYNGSGGLINYYLITPLTGNASTLAIPPADQPTALQFSNLAEAGFTLSFSPASTNPDGYLVIQHTGIAQNFIPTDGVAYSAGETAGDGIVAYSGSNNSFTESDLNSATQYFYQVYSFNGSANTLNYLESAPLEGNRFTLTYAPGSQPANLAFSAITVSLINVDFDAATPASDGYLVLRRPGAWPSVLPADGLVYTRNNMIGDGIVAYVGNGTSFIDSSLSQNVYYYHIFAYNGTDQTTNYLEINPLTGTQRTLFTEPVAHPTNLTFSDPTDTTLTLSFSVADGTPTGYLVIRKAGSSPAFMPRDGQVFTAGETIGDGIVAYSGSDTSFTDKNLIENTVYYYNIFSYNGLDSLTNYLTSLSPLEDSHSTLIPEPSAQPSDLVFSQPGPAQLILTFNPPDIAVSGYLVVRSAENAPVFIPSDGTSYTPGESFGSDIIAYFGINSSFTDLGLTENTVYHYNIYSYNGNGQNINYITDDPLYGTRSTLAPEPTAQPSDILFSNISLNSFTVSFTAATPTPNGYIALRSDNTAPSDAPTKGQPYVIGDSISNGIVTFLGNSTTFNQTELSEGKEFNYAIYSFNGSGSAINYLLDAPLQDSQINDAEGPEISNLDIDPSPVDIGQNVEISARIEDISAVHTVLLRYKKGGEDQFQNSQNMTAEGNIYRGTITGTAITEAGVIFRISAYDALSNEGIFDGSLQINIPSGTISTATTEGNPYQSGFPEKQWRMISIPLDLDGKEVGDVLNDFGSPGSTTWKLYEGSENDVSGSAQFIPGKAYWLQQALGKGNVQITLGSGKIIDANAAMITLLPGWNQIGNPYNFAIDWEDGTNAPANTNIKGPIRWDGSKYTGTGQSSGDTTGLAELVPWDGYFVYNAANINQSLTINPSGGGSMQKIAAKHGNKNMTDQNAWQINFKVRSKDKEDIYNFIGMADDASDQEDRYDLPELPVIGDYISLHFDHFKADEQISPYTIDYLATSDEGAIWTMHVESNINSHESVLNWQYSDVPDDLEMAILDVTNNAVVNIEKGGYVFHYRYQSHPYQFKVMVGNETWVEEKLQEERSKLPGEYSLAQNFPNPFNPMTTIRFTLKKQSRVSLVVYNILGEKVKTLLSNRVYDTGMHEISWNARDDRSRSVASGIYIYSIRIDGFKQSKKMIHIK